MNKKIKEDVKIKVAKIRINNTEYNEFDEAAKKLNTQKTVIIREAVKEYLSARNIEIWNN